MNSNSRPQIFNHLIATFDFAFRNMTETTFQGRRTARDRIGYYIRSFGAIAFLVIEVKLRIGGRKAQLDAIGQVIAECDGQAPSDAVVRTHFHHVLMSQHCSL